MGTKRTPISSLLCVLCLLSLSCSLDQGSVREWGEYQSILLGGTAATAGSDPSTYYQSLNILSASFIASGAEIVSFLPLQMSLYFNAFYSPLWLVASVMALQTKYSLLATHYQLITILIYIVMFIAETARLYLGYQGNLREKVPELAGFWLLTLLQTPLTIYLLANIDTVVLPIERAVNIVLLLFLLAQLLLGLRALQLMVKAQAVKFHLSQFSSLREETVTNN